MPRATDVDIIPEQLTGTGGGWVDAGQTGFGQFCACAVTNDLLTSEFRPEGEITSVENDLSKT